MQMQRVGQQAVFSTRQTAGNIQQRKVAAPKFGMDPITLGIIGAVVAIGGGYGLSGFKIIRQAEVGAVEKMGKYTGQVGPGLQWVEPVTTKIRRVDTKRERIALHAQQYMTKDKATVTVDGVVYVKVVNPEKALYEVENYHLAVQDAAQGTLRQMVAEMDFDAALQSRETIKHKLSDRFHDSEKEWGVKVTDIELQKLDPNTELQQALDAQKIAAQNKIATETRAEAEKAAAVTKAEAEKESAIRSAQGLAESTRLQAEAKVLQADAERRAAIARADGEEQAIRKIKTAEADMAKLLIQKTNEAGASDETIRLQLIKQLPEFVKGANTVIMPADMGGLMGSLFAVTNMLKEKPAAKPEEKTEKK